MSDWTGEYLTMIVDCEKRETKLNDWETQFIASIRSRLETKKTITAKQLDTLNNIWERVTTEQMTH